MDHGNLVSLNCSLDTRMDEEKEEIINNTRSIPLELVNEILTRVPATSVMQFKWVSKDWLNLISNPNFIKRHISESIRANSNGTLIIHQGNTLYTLDFHNPNLRATKLYYPKNIKLPQLGMLCLVGSCNGLLCVDFDDRIALYNPATQAHKIIPQHPKRQGVICEKIRNIFAYDCISDDYKVLRFEKPRHIAHFDFLYPENYQWRILQYSLRTNSWEIIENPPWDQDSVMFPGVVANNSVYWMASNHSDVKCFDLFTRRYSSISLPEKISPGYSPRLAVLGGGLFIVTYYFDIWKLEELGAQESCWTQIFRCPSSQWNIIYNLATGLPGWRTTNLALAGSEDGRKILVALVCGPLNFICCDLESREANMIEVPGLTSNKFSAILPWTGSLVPL